MKYLVRSTIVSMSTAHTHFDIEYGGWSAVGMVPTCCMQCMHAMQPCRLKSEIGNRSKIKWTVPSSEQVKIDPK